MCGIVGYVGQRQAAEILLNGLGQLEYRGYDSAGISILDDHRLETRRTVGRVKSLVENVSVTPIAGSIGVAHTRWATHGRPSEQNAHPHLDATGRISLVHNGIIENHAAIRSFLEQQGVAFSSETDTEALVQLIGFLYSRNGDLLGSVRQALCDVQGTFGVVVLCADAPRTLIAARRGSPLIVGVGEGEYVVSSDASAIITHTSRVVYLDDNEIVTLDPAGMHVATIDAAPVEKEVQLLEMTLAQIELAGFEHHMLKEIFEQPETLRNAMRGRVNLQTGEITLGGLKSCERELPRAHRALLFGCGTAWHAAMVGEYLFEDLARLPTDVDYASELRYRNPIIEQGTLAIAVSQSGETADTLAAVREVKTKGATVLGVVNGVGSSIARETEAGVYLHVGPEIGVASTKAFTGQVAVLTMLALYLGRRRHLSNERTEQVLRELDQIPEKVKLALELSPQVKALAERLAEWDNWLYLGRGVNYPLALEGALKLKEISYIHAEGLPAAEMKHGPIAMIDPGMPVVVIAPRDHTYGKILSNIEEVRSRDGRVIVVANEPDRELERLADEVLYVPSTIACLSPLVTAIPLQLLAYHMAVVRGHDVDKPRNLAKSVTVEQSVMHLRVIVYEDPGWQKLLPLVYVRATFQLLCGATDLLSRIKRLAADGSPVHARNGHAPGVEVWCRPLLADVVARQTALPANQPLAAPALLLNGRGIWRSLPALDAGEASWVGTAGPQNRIACIAADAALASQLSSDVLLDELKTRTLLAGLARRDVSPHVTLLDWPWHFVNANEGLLRHDWSDDMAGVAGSVGPGSYLVNESAVHIGWGTKIKPCVVIDAEDGPVWIGDNVTIFPHSYVQGPAWIGDGTLIQPGATVHAGTTIGPRSKIGGEIEASIIQGFSNKQHDGFLGHSYVGSWVNIAADCINSDLKNTYGKIRVPINGRNVESGEMFVGMFVGDYSKAGINVSFPTGAVIGFCSSVFAARSPKFVPSFAWLDGDSVQRYDEERGLAIARKVMARRQCTMSPPEEQLFLAVRQQALAVEKQTLLSTP